MTLAYGGRRRTTSSRDDASKKPDTPLSRAGTQGDVGFGDPALPTPITRRWRDGKDQGNTTLWCEEEKICTGGRRLALNMYTGRNKK
jgi:hypothetical protein